MDIADLNLSVRAFNAVCRAGIKTIPELYDKYQLESEKLRLLVGKRSFEEIGDALAKHREEVFAENARVREQPPELEPGEYFIEYDPEVWGDDVTFDALSRMEGQLVIVNDSWYPGDTPEDDGEGEVMRVLFTEGDTVILDNGEPCREEITRQEMDDSVNCRCCTKVWKVKEAHSMNEEKATVIVPEDYTRDVTLTRSIIANAQAAQQSLYEVCKGLKEMRDGKLYKELGYANFEDYTENEVGIGRRHAYRYLSIAEGLEPDFVTSMSQIGTTKLALLAKLDEPTREAITEAVDVENATVKELREQIAALTAERDENEHAAELLSAELDDTKEKLASKDKQFQAALDSKEAQLKAAKESGEKSLSDCKTYLNGRIHELEARIQELESMPVQHDLTDADAAAEIARLKRELEDEQLRYTVLEGSAKARARKAADEVREEYEKRIAELTAEKPEAVTDTKAVFKAYLANAADALTRLMTYLEGIKGDDNMALYVSKVDGIVEMTQERRNAL